MFSEAKVYDVPILPVILGGDFGVYGIGRSFNEAFGCRCLCVANAPTISITASTFFDVHTIPAGASDEVLLHHLRGIAAAYPDRQLILMANHDIHSAFVARNREALEESYALPFPSSEVIQNLTDKAAFARACQRAGINTPETVVVDFAQARSATWSAPEVSCEFPVVAKASNGGDYDHLEFEGKRKIWFIESADELESLWATLIDAGFTGQFLVQELIPGDNTQMRSITAYVDSFGQVTVIGSARVLLEDHAPTMIGNPVAMITEEFPELWEKAERLLVESGYRGFANFDVKIDPRNSRAVFFEVNPRIGRNNWYMSAGGANPMIPMVRDLIFGENVCATASAADDEQHAGDESGASVEVHGRRVCTREVLYSMVPDSLLLHYIKDDSLKQRVKTLIRSGRRVDPLINPVETSLHRSLIVRLQKLNQIRKFRRYYPHVTDKSF